MKAITLQQYGGPDDLIVGDRPEPKVGPGEVLIEVCAAGVNPVDWKLAAGGLDAMMEARFPLIPGWDVSGIVTDVGLDVSEYSVGDEVLGYIRKDTVELGAYAERVAANVRLLARKPATLGWEQAAGLPLAGLTAYQSLRRAGVIAGETVLIHAAAGGVGSLGTQIAAATGARVIGTASERNHTFLRQLGAEPVAYGEGWLERVRALAPDGVDAVLDFVGGDILEPSVGLLRSPERLVSIVGQDALGLGGHSLWVRPDAADLAALGELAEAGKLTVHVERSLPLDQAAEAWRLSQSGRTRGKIVLTTV